MTKRGQRKSPNGTGTVYPKGGLWYGKWMGYVDGKRRLVARSLGTTDEQEARRLVARYAATGEVPPSPDYSRVLDARMVMDDLGRLVALAVDDAQIEVLQLDGAGRVGPWFSLPDIAKALEYSDAAQARKHVDEAALAICQSSSSGQVRAITAVNEAGLYELLMATHKKAARPFKRWVLETVIPFVRKQGGSVQALEARLGSMEVELDARMTLQSTSLVRQMAEQSAALVRQISEQGTQLLRHMTEQMSGLRTELMAELAKDRNRQPAPRGPRAVIYPGDEVARLTPAQVAIALGWGKGFGARVNQCLTLLELQTERKGPRSKRKWFELTNAGLEWGRESPKSIPVGQHPTLLWKPSVAPLVAEMWAKIRTARPERKNRRK